MFQTTNQYIYIYICNLPMYQNEQRCTLKKLVGNICFIYVIWDVEKGNIYIYVVIYLYSADR